MADGVLEKEEIVWSARFICPNILGGPSGIREEHLKIWFAVTQAEENPDPSRCQIAVDIMQMVLATR